LAAICINGSPIGQGYHDDAFGTRGRFVAADKDGDGVKESQQYKVGSGTRGAFTGVLNTAPAHQLGNVLPVRECNIKGIHRDGRRCSA